MPSGGKREGAGRPLAYTVAESFKIRRTTLKALRKHVPKYERSKFVDDSILEKLARENSPHESAIF